MAKNVNTAANNGFVFTIRSTIQDATSFLKTVLGNPNGVRTSDKYFTLGDIRKYNRSKMVYDTIAQTPGGGFYRFKDKKTERKTGGKAYFNRSSDAAIDREFGLKRYSLDVMVVDGKDRPVLVEDEDGYIHFSKSKKRICPICGKVLAPEQYFMMFRKADADVMERLLTTPFHQKTPKFELRMVDKRSTKGKLWLAFENAERCRV